MNTTPFISVIIPAYKAASYIEETVRSVLNQTYTHFELIIVDDGSPDDQDQIIEQLCKEDSRIRYIKQKNGGVSSARNHGFQLSSGKYIAFLDADDVWLPKKLEYQMAVFKVASPQVGFVHSSYFYINEHGADIDSVPITPPKIRGDIFLPLLFEQYSLSGSASSVLVRRDILDRVGYFDTDLFHGEDWDMWIRLAQVCHVDFTPEPVVGIRIHDQSTQHKVRPDREFQHLQQHLIIFSKWPEEIKARSNFISYLRRHTINVTFPLMKKPKEAIRVYRQLSNMENDLARNLFDGPLDFGWEISLSIARLIYFNLRKMLGVSD